MISERRKTLRMRTLLDGRVSFNRNNSTLDCVIRNLGEEGALLLLSDAVALPQAFQLDIPNRQRAYKARLCWRDGQRIGVVFAGTSDEPALEPAAVIPLDLARRLKAAQDDNDRLKSRIRELTEG